MPFLYDENDDRTETVQPQLTRVRHNYRAPRSSHKFNLEIDQFRFDIHRLYERQGTLQQALFRVQGLALNGGEILDVDVHIDDATPGDEDMIVEGLNALIDRLNSLRTRMDRLNAR